MKLELIATATFGLEAVVKRGDRSTGIQDNKDRKRQGHIYRGRARHSKIKSVAEDSRQSASEDG